MEGRYNQPLIGHKRNLYEGGIRVPDVLQWKARLEGRQKHEHPVSSLDIFPTLLAAAGSDGLSAYNLDGVDLFRFWRAPSKAFPTTTSSGARVLTPLSARGPGSCCCRETI